ncbi:MAG: hypothetical protein QNL91_10185 [Candidatus Krumholzibacteria bacterium]|nr:hypothetical protein [Candidatus Krumholzibacteria bacterium]
MNSPTTATQTTLLTSHKGVDLHAASALLVMKERLEGGDRLARLFRCELHTFWDTPDGWDAARLLDIGRFYNPNKHHFGMFAGPADGAAWNTDETSGQRLTGAWPGPVQDTDLEARQSDSAALYNALLGGVVPDDCTPFDVVSFPYGQAGPVVSGVLWRLVLWAEAGEAAEIGEKLAVARHRKQGLLINPHMESWFAVAW